MFELEIVIKGDDWPGFLGQVKRQMNDVERRVREKDIADRLVRRMRKNVPVVTGQLRDSIGIQRERGITRIGSNLIYAGIVDRKAKYIHRSLEEVRIQIQNERKGALQDLFDDAASAHRG